MAEVTRVANPSLASVVSYNGGSDPPHQITGVMCGEDIPNGVFVYIDPDDYMMYVATGAAADEKADVVGFVCIGNSEGETCTIWRGVNIGYGAEVGGNPAPAGPLYLSGTVAGGLADAASVGGTAPIARVLDEDGRISIGWFV
jgi:hypothetical protein